MKSFFERLEDVLADPANPSVTAFRKAVRGMIDWISVDPDDHQPDARLRESIFCTIMRKNGLHVSDRGA